MSYSEWLSTESCSSLWCRNDNIPFLVLMVNKLCNHFFRGHPLHDTKQDINSRTVCVLSSSSAGLNHIWPLWSCFNTSVPRCMTHKIIASMKKGSGSLIKSGDHFTNVFFHHDSNLIWFYPHVNSIKLIAMKFCTWHACAKLCSDIIARNRVTVDKIFHWILIMRVKRLWIGPLELIPLISKEI